MLNIDDALILLIGLAVLILFMIVGAIATEALLTWKDRRALKKLQKRDWKEWKEWK